LGAFNPDLMIYRWFGG